ncbi:MAG TPA: hypothetical protein VFX61_15215 [Micromonosporaceae bacterium]|nr:hypothetical protein [Micromonosporaceae bacterium]
MTCWRLSQKCDNESLRDWAVRGHGLTDVHTVMHAESWTGGGPGAHLAAITIDELRPALLAAGMLDDHLDQVQHLLSDPRLVLAGHLLYSTSGQQPNQ